MRRPLSTKIRDSAAGWPTKPYLTKMNFRVPYPWPVLPRVGLLLTRAHGDNRTNSQPLAFSCCPLRLDLYKPLFPPSRSQRAERAQYHSPRRKPWEKFAQARQPAKRAQEMPHVQETALAPATRAGDSSRSQFPTAYAVGYALPPQRGKNGLVGDPGRPLRGLRFIAHIATVAG